MISRCLRIFLSCMLVARLESMCKQVSWFQSVSEQGSTCSPILRGYEPSCLQCLAPCAHSLQNGQAVEAFRSERPAEEARERERRQLLRKVEDC